MVKSSIDEPYLNKNVDFMEESSKQIIWFLIIYSLLVPRLEFYINRSDFTSPTRFIQRLYIK